MRRPFVEHEPVLGSRLTPGLKPETQNRLEYEVAVFGASTVGLVVADGRMPECHRVPAFPGETVGGFALGGGRPRLPNACHREHDHECHDARRDDAQCQSALGSCRLGLHGEILAATSWGPGGSVGGGADDFACCAAGTMRASCTSSDSHGRGSSGLHPPSHSRRSPHGNQRDHRHAVPAGAERLPAHRPCQVHLSELRRRGGVRRPGPTCATTTPIRCARARNTSTPSSGTSPGSAFLGPVRPTRRTISNASTNLPRS